MRFVPALRWSAGITCAVALLATEAQQAQSGAGNIVIRSTTTLVYLDVTVLDKKGNPVATGLTKDDFLITEDKKPQRLFSFEAPEIHKGKLGRKGYDAVDGTTPRTILVLDLLNSTFSQFAFLRYSMQKYLEAQPAQLNAPTEMMVIGNDSLELLQGFTRSREDLLLALKHVPGALPYKRMSPSFFSERFGQSIDALQQIALQSKGMPGRKNIIWVGNGGPSLQTIALNNSLVQRLVQYVHETTNMLVDERVSLFVVYPGLATGGKLDFKEIGSAETDPGYSDPFAGDINFGVFVAETGGKLYFNRNDVDMQIEHSQEMGSHYYTITYQPQEAGSDGKFRRIHVSLRDPNLTAVTKQGYFAPDEHAPVDPQKELVVNLAEAVRSKLPLGGLGLKVADVARHTDTRSAEIGVLVPMRNLRWQPADDGQSTATVMVEAASRTDAGELLASRLERITLTAASQDRERLARDMGRVHIALQVPKRTDVVRVVVENEEGGQMGSAEVRRTQIDAAPATPTPPTPHEPAESKSGAGR